MGQRTLLYDLHLALGAKTVDFGGWDMPLHYGSQVEEHHQVRTDCGVFDVSHMTVIDVDGTDATVWLQRLLANDVARLDDTGKALYSPLLNEQGGVIDDLIVYRTETGYRLVNNAATRVKVLDWLQSQRAGFSVDFQVRPDLAILAIQGPRAREKVAALLSPARAALIRELRPFEGVADGDWFIARTGYTGEDGLEIIFPGDQAVAFFNDLVGAGIAPSGLGARDTLRLEAGMNLYGQDIDENHTPLTSNLAGASPGNRPSATSSAVSACLRKSSTACRKSWWVWCWKSAVYCAPIRSCVLPALAKGRSPVVVSRLR